MRKRLMILLSFIFMLVAYGNTEQKTNYKIQEIITRNLVEVPEATIVNMMTEKVGDNFSTENMISDYKKIKELDYVEQVALYPEYSEGGINIVVKIQEKPNAKELLTQQGIIPMSERDIVDKSIVIKDVRIYGNTNLTKKEIMKDIPVKVGGYYSKKRIAEGYENLRKSGLFRQVIPDIKKQGNGVVVEYHVVENPVITGVNIIGNTIYSTEELMLDFKTKPNQVLNANNLRADGAALLKKYNDDGYVLARILDVTLNNSFEVEIFLSEGITRNIEYKKMVTKQRGERRQPTDNLLKTKEYVIDREVELHEDTIFNINEYNETVKNLMRLGYIKNVKYETRDIIGDPDGQTVVLLIEEDRTARIQGAVSYGSELGLLGMLSLEETNWKGRGQDLSLNFEKSDEDYTSFSINFSDPWIKDTDRISWGWSLYRNEYENDDSRAFNKIETSGFRVNVGKGLSKYVRLNLSGKVEYVETNPLDFSELNDTEKKEYYDDKYWVYSLTPSISYDTRNSRFDPTKGEFYKFGVELGYATGEEADYFANTTFEARKYHRGFTKDNTFAYRLVLGIQTDGTKESQRYWVGGGSTLRGFDGGDFKGTQKAVINIENRTRFNDVLGGVIFFDIGRAWNYKGIDQGYMGDKTPNSICYDEKFPDDIAMSAGVGLRINTPMGPLRFDFGWPIGSDRRSGMEFYFNMGQSF
ncbi:MULTISPECIES: BamA/OMP85 family outer membrane protein [Fusobacterium]|uniref:BamA/OMP85 family outer membrane protein n=1 Tax=Fusobacterium TaxID=848 RepID=UPI001F2DB145|nr:MULTISPECIES: BamA/TamA family outer membrane protein [Fusobacterium]MCF2612603.1 BamA/TamA family outer membrane protein [Fusobacterium perfoetens]MDY2980150.1 BamA/TamA family outer membrane protein [Fusobacterium sp.]